MVSVAFAILAILGVLERVDAEIVCNNKHEFCLDSECKIRKLCTYPLHGLERKLITRMYKLTEKAADGHTELWVEYEYELDSECGNRMKVSRREWMLGYKKDKTPDAGTTRKECSRRLYEDMYMAVGPHTIRPSEWYVFTANFLLNDDRDRFSSDEQYHLYINVEDFNSQKYFVVKNKVTEPNDNKGMRDVSNTSVSCNFRIAKSVDPCCVKLLFSEVLFA